MKLVKNICYHPPSLLKNQSRKKKRRSSGIDKSKNDPNAQLFELYQTSLRASADPLADGMSTAAPISGQESARKQGGEALISGGQSTDKGESTLPEIHTNSQLSKPSIAMGYETHQASGAE
mmetsp:Transcript_26377/g.35236  ORF Transcript_26377/g.35236 Transcript_26377/m.35236 type:complete len:121 (+) Transcript_26377:534-896(+)